jgi:hypothetical protein
MASMTETININGILEWKKNPFGKEMEAEKKSYLLTYSRS